MGSEQFCAFSLAEALSWRDLALDYLTLCADKLVVFYEDAVRDYETELVRILRFLRVPISQERLDCLRRHPLDRHKRRTKANLARFYCEEGRAMVESAVREVDEALQEHMLLRLPKEYFNEL